MAVENPELDPALDPLEGGEDEIVETPEEKADREAYDAVFFGGEEPADDSSIEADPEPDPEPKEGSEEEPDPTPDPEPAPNEEEPAPKEEEDPDPDPTPDPEKEPSPDMVTLKWNGQEVTVTTDEAIKMAQQNFDITHKYQEVSKMKKNVQSEIDLIEKIKAGGDDAKEALILLSKQGKIDPVDLIGLEVSEEFEQGNSKPVEPFKISPEVSKLMDEVQSNEPLFNELADTEKYLPESVVNTMAQDPETFYAIVNEVRSGDAKIVLPRVQARLATLDAVDRAVVLNDPQAYAQFYVNVKDSMIQEYAKANPNPNTPDPKPNAKKNFNGAELSVKKSTTSKRDESSKKLDAMSSDETYKSILERMNNQR